jgi:hypothetical protein
MGLSDACVRHLHLSTNTDMLLAYYSHGTFFHIFAIAHDPDTDKAIVVVKRPPLHDH